eukprot:scaffold1067_cov253-Prasinococcus_capsulatus_cf.AAC.1
MASAAGAGHSLVFKVMRLCRPSIPSDEGSLKLPSPGGALFGGGREADGDGDDGAGDDDDDDDAADHGGGAQQRPFARRVRVPAPCAALGAQGLLLLPQSFGCVQHCYASVS